MYGTCMAIFYVNVYRIDIIRQREVKKVKSAEPTANSYRTCRSTRYRQYITNQQRMSLDLVGELGEDLSLQTVDLPIGTQEFLDLHVDLDLGAYI